MSSLFCINPDLCVESCLRILYAHFVFMQRLWMRPLDLHALSQKWTKTLVWGHLLNIWCTKTTIVTSLDRLFQILKPKGVILLLITESKLTQAYNCNLFYGKHLSSQSAVCYDGNYFKMISLFVQDLLECEPTLKTCQKRSRTQQVILRF